jgi:hypothetical protein
LRGEHSGYPEKGQKDKKPARLFYQGNFAEDNVQDPTPSTGSWRDIRQKTLQDQGNKQGNGAGKQEKEKPVQGQGESGAVKPQIEEKYRQSGDKDQQKKDVHAIHIIA